MTADFIYFMVLSPGIRPGQAGIVYHNRCLLMEIMNTDDPEGLLRS